MFVLGIDPGLTVTGFGLVRKDHTLEAVAAGVITTDPGVAIAKRLTELHRNLQALISEYRPSAMAIEQVFTNQNRQTAIAVGRAAGVAILAAGQAGLAVFEYVPTLVKSAVTGDGSASKKAVQTMVARRLKLTASPHQADAADALAVAICHIQSLQVTNQGGAAR